MRYAHGKCRDMSQGGLRIEVPEAIPLHATVGLQAERIKFTGSATVKHVTREGAKYILGLELSHALREEVLAEAGGHVLVGSD